MNKRKNGMCKQGHRVTGDNARIRLSTGYASCRKCDVLAAKRRQQLVKGKTNGSTNRTN